MAKYIRHGETFNGNGTSPDAATVDGGVGAWNSLNVFDNIGTPNFGGGALLSGEKVFIRSKDAAGADITRTAAANINFGSASATSGAWITWVIDNGSVWPGIDGTITYEFPSTYTGAFRSYNAVFAMGEDRLVLKETNTNVNAKQTVNIGQWHASENIFIDLSANTNTGGSTVGSSANGKCVLSNAHIKLNYFYNSGIVLGNEAVLFSPRVELTRVQTQNPVFQTYGGRLTVHGGRIYGTGAAATVKLWDTSGTCATFIGTEIPKTMDMVPTTATTGQWRFEAMGLDNGIGSLIQEAWGIADSRADSYPPTLSTYADLSVDTPWSWRIYPKNTSAGSPFVLPTVKVFTDTAATKTVTANVLIADSFTTADKSNVWIEVEYTDDSTGLQKRLTSRDHTGASLTSSSATWSSTSYGATNFYKRQLSVTTPTSIKQNTPIIVGLCGTIKSASALDLVFFCPDIVLS